MEERSGGRPLCSVMEAIAYVGRVRHCCALLQKVELDVQVV
ncbi:hypothetical protein [Nostoc sp.]